MSADSSEYIPYPCSPETQTNPSPSGGGGGGDGQTSPKTTAPPLNEPNNNKNNSPAAPRKSYRLSSWSPDWSLTSPTSPSYVVVSPSASPTDKKTNDSICEVKEKEGAAFLSPASSSLPRLGSRVTKEAPPPPGRSPRSCGARGSEARLLAVTGSSSVEVVEEEEDDDDDDDDEKSNGMMRSMEEMENRMGREIEAVGQLGQTTKLEEEERQAGVKVRVVSCPVGMV